MISDNLFLYQEIFSSASEINIEIFSEFTDSYIYFYLEIVRASPKSVSLSYINDYINKALRMSQYDYYEGMSSSVLRRTFFEYNELVTTKKEREREKN